MTVSSQAQAFLDANQAQSFPPVPFEAPAVERIRALHALQQAPGLAALESELVAEIATIEVAGVPVVRLEPRVKRPSELALIYMHGGAFAFGSARDATSMQLAQATGLTTYSVEYRLSPEHPYPAALEDCLGVYRALAAQVPLVGAGLSAGGGLLLSTLLRAHQEGLPMPAAIAVLTPAADLTRTGDSYAFNEGRDPVLKWQDQMDKALAAYSAGHDPADPLLSPVYAQFPAGFPPTLITTGTRDLILSGCVRLYWALKRAGVRAELRVWEGLWHAFHVVPDLPESTELHAEVAAHLLVSETL